MRTFILCSITLVLIHISSFGQEIVIPSKHVSKITCLEFSPDGLWLASAGNDGMVKIWRVRDGKMLHNLALSSDSSFVNMLKFSPDGSRVLTASNDGVIVWAMTTGRPIRYLLNHKNKVISAEFSPDGRYILSASEDSTAILWDAESYLALKVIRHKGSLYAAKFSPNSKQIITLAADTPAQVWSVPQATLLYTLSAYKGDLITAEFSAKGDYLLTSGQDSTVRIWHANTFEQWYYIKAYPKDDPAPIPAFSCNGNYFATCSGKKLEMNIWDTEAGKFYSSMGIKMDSAQFTKQANSFEALFEQFQSIPLITDYAFNPKQDILLIGYQPGVVDIYHIKNWFLRRIEAGGAVSKVKFSPDGLHFAIGTFTAGVLIGNLQRDELISTQSDLKQSILAGPVELDQKEWLISINDGNIQLWDMYTGKISKTFPICTRYDFPVANFSLDGKYLAYYCEEKSQFEFIQTVDNKQLPAILYDQKISVNFNYLLFSPNNLYFCYANMDRFSIWDFKTRQLIFSEKFEEKTTTRCLGWLSDNELLFTVVDQKDSRSKLFIWDLREKKATETFATSKNTFGPVTILSPKLNYAITYSMMDSTSNGHKIIDLKNKKTLPYSFKMPFSFLGYNITISENEKYLATIDLLEQKAIVRELLTGKISATLDLKEKMAFQLKYCGDYLFIWQANGKILAWQPETNRQFYFEDPGNRILEIDMSKDQKYLICVHQDGTTSLWDFPKKTKIATFIMLQGGDYVLISPDQYYTSSKGALQELSFKIGTNLYSIDQYDLLRNRPDLVYSRFPGADTARMRVYRQAYLKRLKSAGLNQPPPPNNQLAPSLEILQKEELPSSPDQRSITLNVKASSIGSRLKKIDVWLNGVPLFGIKGTSASGNEFNKTITLQLSPGENRIEVACQNETGIRSLRDFVLVDYSPPQPQPGVYFLGAGVSRYQDVNYNLNYAAKDIRDIARLVSQHYPGAIIDTLFDARATAAAIRAWKARLAKTSVDDLVIVALSGHGLLDLQRNFYFATHETNFRNPAQSALGYQQLEWLLDSIPARHKLLLLDACHSGEIEQDSIVPTSFVAPNGQTLKLQTRNIRAKGLEPVNTGQQKTKMQDAFVLMRELFTDFSYGNGAVVIAAAAGREIAIEGDAWKNGVFSYAIRNGLSKPPKGKFYLADSNQDGKVNVLELKNYVAAEVSRITKNAQQPTARQENLDFRVW